MWEGEVETERKRREEEEEEEEEGEEANRLARLPRMKVEATEELSVTMLSSSSTS